MKKLADDNIIEHLEGRNLILQDYDKGVEAGGSAGAWTSLEIRYNYGEIENIGYENNQALNYVIIRK